VLGERERKAQFSGIYVDAALLRTALPTDCLEKNGTTCGTVSLKLSKNLLDFFEIEDEPEKERQIKLFVRAVNRDSLAVALVFAQTGEVRAIFSIKSLNQRNEDGSIREEERKLWVERQFSDGTGRVEDVQSANKLFLAYKELVELWKNSTIQKTDIYLLCGTCPAKIDGLPRTII